MANKKYFLEATKEVEQGNLDEALWAKQLAVAKGDEEKAKYEYIVQRAEALQKEVSLNYFNLFIKKIKKYLSRLMLLVVAGFIIYSTIVGLDYREKRLAIKQQIEHQEIEQEIRIEKEKASIEQQEIEQEIRIEKEKAAELLYKNSLTGLVCRITTMESKVNANKNDPKIFSDPEALYDPFYLIINHYKWRKQFFNITFENDTWGDTLSYVVWDNHKRLNFAYPRIRKHQFVIDPTFLLKLDSSALSEVRRKQVLERMIELGGKKRTVYQQGRRYNFSTTSFLLTGKDQKKLLKPYAVYVRDARYEKINEFNISRDTLKFFATIGMNYHGDIEAKGRCSEIAYSEVLGIVEKAQKKADPDNLIQ